MRERAVCFGDPSTLTGVLTRPEGDPGAARPAFVFLNAGILHHVGPSRIHVILARRLAEEGFASLRFDFSGIGDSPSRRSSAEFEERSLGEVREAMDWMTGVLETESFVLAGLCSGADAALRAGASNEDVRGLVLLDGPAYRTRRYYLHRFLPRLLRWESWRNLLTGKTYVGPFVRRIVGRFRSDPEPASTEPGEIFGMPIPPREVTARRLRAVVERGGEALALFTGGSEIRYNHAGQLLESLEDPFDGRVEEVFLPGATHTFTTRSSQQELVRTVVGWARERWPDAEAHATPFEQRDLLAAASLSEASTP